MNAPSHKKMDDQNQSGYSLVELLILLACIGVLSGFVFIQAMNVLPTYKSNSAMNQVIQQMRVARNTAIADRRAVIVNISAATGTMQLRQVPPNGGPPAALSTAPRGRSERVDHETSQSCASSETFGGVYITRDSRRHARTDDWGPVHD